MDSHAMELGLAIASNNKKPEVQNYLLALMNKLEQQKSDNPDLGDLEGCETILKSFAAEKLQQAEEEYFARLADKNTSRLYYAAGTFFEVLATFSPDKKLDEVTKKSVLYCKWRATEILKAIKEGRDPYPEEESSQIDDEPIVPPPAPSTTPTIVPPPAPSTTPKFQPYTSKSPRMSYKKSSDGYTGNVTVENRQDAEEYCRFVLTSLRTQDDAAAIRYLKLALEQLEG